MSIGYHPRGFNINLMTRLQTPYWLLIDPRQSFSSESDPLGNTRGTQWLNQDTVIVGETHLSIGVISQVAKANLDELWQVLHRSLLWRLSLSD